MPEHHRDRATGPGAPFAPPSSPRNGGERFFGWLRSLGVTRQNGWIGGVCGGVAARLGIDPIIVRGIVAVVAVLGGPAFLLYAAAWLMLPDAQGDIHLERLIKGHFDPPIIAIIVIALFSLLPFAQGFWWAGAQFWGGLSWFSSVGRVLWTLVVIGLIVGVVIWAARSGKVPPPPPYQAPTADAAGAASAGPATPTAAGTDQAGGDFADWRTRQEAWKADYAAWSAERDDARVIRQQRSAELRAQSQALAAEADEARRRRRAARPRTSAAFVFLALGIALVAGGLAAAIALGGASDYTLAIALAVATGVIGLAIVIAGILRRRSGFLTFVSLVLVLATFGAAVPPRSHALMLLPRAAYWNAQHVAIYQPVGSLELNYDSSGAREADVVQSAGDVTVQLQNGVSAEVVVVQHTVGSSVEATRFDDDGDRHPVAPSSSDKNGESGLTHTYVLGNSTPTIDVHIDQVAGAVRILSYPESQG